MTCRLVLYFNRPITFSIDFNIWTVRIDPTAGCRVHLYDNISFGNLSDRLSSQCVFLPHWHRNTYFRPVGVDRLFPSRTEVTLRKFSAVRFFAQMTNIVTSFLTYRLVFHTCGLSAVYTEVINIAFPKWVYKNLLIDWCVRFIIYQQLSKRFFGLFVISIHKVQSILVKHAFSDNSDLFPFARLPKRARYRAFRLISTLYFSLGNMFCSNTIALAFWWRPWVNNRDTTWLSVASAIKSFRMILLL